MSLCVLQSYPVVFEVLALFLDKHTNVEIDLCECVLNGGWEALEQGRVELIVGAPKPVHLQKGYRAVLPKLRRIITHDTSMVEMARSEGWSSSTKCRLPLFTVGEMHIVKIDRSVKIQYRKGLQ